MSIITNQEALFWQIVQPLLQFSAILERPCIVHATGPDDCKTEKPEVGIHNSLNIDSMPLAVTTAKMSSIVDSWFVDATQPPINCPDASKVGTKRGQFAVPLRRNVLKFFCFWELQRKDLVDCNQEAPGLLVGC